MSWTRSSSEPTRGEKEVSIEERSRRIETEKQRPKEGGWQGEKRGREVRGERRAEEGGDEELRNKKRAGRREARKEKRGEREMTNKNRFSVIREEAF